MNTDTPKAVLAQEITNLIQDFEEKTGVEVHDIHLSRLEVTETGCLCEKTIKIRLRFELR